MTLSPRGKLMKKSAVIPGTASPSFARRFEGRLGSSRDHSLLSTARRFASITAACVPVAGCASTNDRSLSGCQGDGVQDADAPIQEECPK